ncbi:NERD domain-containing protein [uncultured Treponema sp.]|uniref:NERD domain-containing protein n=1 Tax=uncultured Treponema sp. TaxID=162155 RepID=UPI0025929115|nr:NERD domain-containing protein [uncultured Treponema sp.]
MTSLIILTFILFVFFIIFFAKGKGKIGEARVSRRLNKLGEDFTVIDDLMIRNDRGDTSQIDHVVLSEYGILVIETKNYQGWIFGKEQSEQWIQVIYKEKFKFRNPIKQNWSHIYALKNVLKDFPNIRYVPIVAFAGSATLKNVEARTPVVYVEDLRQEINNQCCCEKSLSKEEIAKIREILTSKDIIEKKDKKEHIRKIRQNMKEKKIKEENLICPRCNNQLVLRQEKYGKFYGCLNYPYCKFTMKY